MGKPLDKPDLSLHDVGDPAEIEGVTMPEYAMARPQVDPYSLAVRRTALSSKPAPKRAPKPKPEEAKPDAE